MNANQIASAQDLAMSPSSSSLCSQQPEVMAWPRCTTFSYIGQQKPSVQTSHYLQLTFIDISLCLYVQAFLFTRPNFLIPLLGELPPVLYFTTQYHLFPRDDITLPSQSFYAPTQPQAELFWGFYLILCLPWRQQFQQYICMQSKR